MKLSRKGLENFSFQKKTITYTLILLLLVSTVLAAYPVTEQLPLTMGIRVSLLNQDPDPVAPGDYVELRFQLTNNGQSRKDVTFEILPEYPFALDLAKPAVQDLGPIYGFADSKDIQTVYYRLRVNENAVEGTETIKIRYKEKGFDWIQQEFDIRIQSKDAALSLISVKTEPESLIQGKEGNLRIEIKNLADSLMKEVTLKLILDDVTTAPFAPIDSSTINRITRIPGKSSKETVFKIAPLPDADSGLYKIPILLSYYDEIETPYNKSDYISVRVGEEPNLRITLDETQIYSSGQTGDIDVRFSNIDATDIKFLNVELLETNYLEVAAPREVYLGNVDSDDYETATFKVYLKKVKGDTVALPLKLTYKDSNNNNYEITKNLELRLYSSSKAKMFGLATKGGSGGIIVVIIIVLLGLFLYRRYKKKKKFSFKFKSK